MPKDKIKVSYQKAARSPSQRRKIVPVARVPQGESPLTQYVEENRDTGIPVAELIQQFQEYDCDHPKDEQQTVAAGVTYMFVRCNRCNRVEKRDKPGTK